jgi:hypothetical protein
MPLLYRQRQHAITIRLVTQGVQVLLDPASKEKQKTEVQACSAMVARVPSKHVYAAICCIVFAICVSCNPCHCPHGCQPTCRV